MTVRENIVDFCYTIIELMRASGRITSVSGVESSDIDSG